MPVQEMDVELGQESVALCRSLRLKVTDGVPRGAVMQLGSAPQAYPSDSGRAG
jgi:hypothetical protein